MVTLSEQSLQEGDLRMAEGGFVSIVPHGETPPEAFKSKAQHKAEADKRVEDVKKKKAKEQEEAKKRAEERRLAAEEKAKKKAEEEEAKKKAEAAQAATEEEVQVTEEPIVAPPEPSVPEPDEEPAQEDGIPELPTEQWKLKEMFAFCDQHGIKLKGSRTKPRIIKQVKEFYGVEVQDE
jgi:flagellar biosynthesis GTPase FlhF